MNIEPLESRIAPASAFVTYNDIDGDLVKITATLPGTGVPPLDAGDLTFVSGKPGQLGRLDLTDNGFTGANIVFTVTKAPAGDGLAHVGYINATNVDLGNVTVKGDIGQIDAGNATTPDTTGLLSLNVRSMGRFGFAAQEDAPGFRSDIVGPLGLLKVTGDVKDALVSVTGGPGGVNGTIGSVTIGGALIGGTEDDSGSIQASGAMGAVKIGKSIAGGAGLRSGLIGGPSLGAVTIGGSLLGGTGDLSGALVATTGGIGAVKVTHDVIGSSGDQSGKITAATNIISVTVGGTVHVGSGDYSGGMIGSAIIAEGFITANETIGPVNIGKDFQGIRGENHHKIGSGVSLGNITIGGSVIDASISTNEGIGAVRIGGDLRGGQILDDDGGIMSITIGGSLIGSDRNLTGYISTAGDIGAIRIMGDVRGGSISGTHPLLTDTGVIQGARITSLFIGGSLVAGIDASTGGDLSRNAYIDVFNDIGPVTINGSVMGGTGANSGHIEAASFGAVTIGGSMVGGTGDFAGVLWARTGGMGAVKIVGNLIGNAGLHSGSISAATNIASLTVGGAVQGGLGDYPFMTTATGVFVGGLVGATNKIGPIKIGKDFQGIRGADPFDIGAGASVGNVTIGGSVIDARISANDGIGAVRITGDLRRGAISDDDGGIVSITIGGSVIGGDSSHTGEIVTGGDIGAIRITGDVRGGSISGTDPLLTDTGKIRGARIASLFIGGSLVAGTDNSTGGNLLRNAYIAVQNDIGPITINGDVIGTSTPNGTALATIAARGQEVVADGATSDIAIKSITIGGRVERAQFLGGYDNLAEAVNGDASIGAVNVGGDWIASNLVAGAMNLGADDAPGGTGANADNLNYGDTHDSSIGAGNVNIVARIASITIAGVVIGTDTSDDHFGFTAQQIGSFQSLGFIAPLNAGTNVIELSPITADVTLREL